MQLLAEGFTNRDISQQLSLTEHTVRNYLFRIFNKLGISNRVELALYVLKQRGVEQRSDLMERFSPSLQGMGDSFVTPHYRALCSNELTEYSHKPPGSFSR